MINETRLRMGIEAAKTGDQGQAVERLTDFLKQNPEHTTAMLWLAYSVPRAQDSLRILEEVLKREPDNRRAQDGARWAESRLAQAANGSSGLTVSHNGQPSRPPHRPAGPQSRKRPIPVLYSRLVIASLASLLLLILVIGGVLFFMSTKSLAAWLPITTAETKGITFMEAGPPVAPVGPPEVEAVSVEAGLAPSGEPAAIEPAAPTVPQKVVPEALRDGNVSEAAPALAQDSPTEAPQPAQLEPALSLAGEDTGRSEALTVHDVMAEVDPRAVDEALLAHKPAFPGEKWIEVNVTAQEVTAWEGNVPVMRFVVSTGLPNTPTIAGKFNIYWKGETTRMIGPGYNLPGVPYTMYYYRGYALHGAYWHNNFGQPMSHGCVNFRPEEARQLFEWAAPILPPGQTQVNASADNPGTLVVVHN